MRKRLIFLLLAMLLLAPWPVAYAYDNAGTGPEPVRIDVAPPSAAPGWKVYGGAIGSVPSPGDLFYIDTTGNAADISATLYLTNTDELVHYYRYLILRVGVYRQDDTGWQRAVRGNGEPLPDTYITMQNGKADLALAGYARYKVTIDSGSFYAYKTAGSSGSVSPRFYLTAE